MEVSIQGDKVEALRLTDESKSSIEKESDSEIDEVMDADGDKGVLQFLCSNDFNFI